jgi:hypothetical protein
MGVSKAEINRVVLQNDVLKQLGTLSAGLSTSPDLSEHQRAYFAHGRIQAMAVRLQTEHPVLARFAQYLESRGVDDKGRPIPISQQEWNTILTLIGDKLSETERDFINELRSRGFFTDAMLREQVDPFRKAQGEERESMVRWAGIKKGTKSVGSQVANLGVALGLFAINPFLLLANVAWQIGGQPRLNKSIQMSFKRELGGYGVERLTGAEVEDEHRLALSHMAGVGGLDSTALDSIVAAAETDAAFVKNLGEARKMAGGADHLTDEQKQLGAASDQYGAAIEKILADHAQRPMTTTNLKRAIYKARAESLTPENVRAAVVTAVDGAFPAKLDQQSNVFAKSQVEFVEYAKDIFAGAEVKTQDDERALKKNANDFLKIAGVLERLHEGAVSLELKDFYREAAHLPFDELMSSKAAKTLKKKLESVEKHANETVAGLDRTVTEAEAVDIAKMVKTAVFDEILPRFIGFDADPKLTKRPQVQMLDGNVRRISFEFSTGMVSSPQGKFSINVGPDGKPDARSLEVHVSEKRAKDVASWALDVYARIFPGSTSVGTVRPGNGAGGFVVGGTVENGARYVKVPISNLGVPDLRPLTA